MRNTAGLRRGNPGNKGGGAKPDAWKIRMRAVLERAQAPDVLAKIISGDILEELGATDDGKPIYGETKNADRLKAIQFAAGYAEGLPTQTYEDLTPEKHGLTPERMLLAIPQMLEVLAVSQQERVKLLQAVEVEAEVVD